MAKGPIVLGSHGTQEPQASSSSIHGEARPWQSFRFEMVSKGAEGVKQMNKLRYEPSRSN